MKNFTEELGINGHLTIIKKMSTGEEEILLDDSNIIVSGMGVGLSYLFTASGSNSILDYQIEKFQIGVSGPPAGGVTSGINELSGSLTSIDEYGTGSNLALFEGTQIVGEGIQTGRVFAAIPASKMTRISKNSVRYTLVVDEEAANDIQRDGLDAGINEIGMFMKNPTGSVDDKPILVCYRTFSDIVKTNDFSLIFRWTINF
tara:strand:- start:558 stop:1163 length:606 start_codon:yes stop_codon:yes gene_type:complete